MNVSSPNLNVYLIGYLGIPYYFLPPKYKNSNDYKKWFDNMIFCNYLNDATNKRISSFKWNNLPPTVDSWTMEIMLLYWGNIGMYRSPNNGEFLCTALIPFGKDGVNPNGMPIDGYLYKLNGRQEHVNLYFKGKSDPITRESSTRKFVDADYNCVWGKENALGIPYIQNLWVKCKQLALRENILDASIENCRQPLIITCDERDYKTVKKELQDIEDNRTKILCYNGAFSKDSLNVLNTGIKPELITIVREELTRCQNALDKELGFNTTPYEKKERLITDEVNSNIESTLASIDASLEWRRRFCEDCNEAFGLNINVEFNFMRVGEEASNYNKSKMSLNGGDLDYAN